MIDTKELRAGNWVMKRFAENSAGPPIFTYKAIGENEYYFTFAHVYFPIPLSPDILGRCGLKHDFGDWFKNMETEGVDEGLPFLRYKKKTGQWYLFNSPLPFQPTSLHQLQNLYYALTKNELAVVLGPLQVRETSHA